MSDRPSAQRAFEGPLPQDKELVLKVIPMPARYAQGRMATVAVNEFIFKQPVRVGDILSFYASMERIGRTSMTVRVEVFAERFRAQGQYIKVTQATLTYVAIDDQGRPREIPRG